MRVVFPDPGEDRRFRTNTPWLEVAAVPLGDAVVLGEDALPEQERAALRLGRP